MRGSSDICNEPQVFGSSGVRGIANREITPEFALNFGLAIGSICSDVMVGCDPRISSRMVEYAVVSGLLSTGCKVVTVGIVPTPTLAIASRHGSGIMITASHNPPEYNGMKFFQGGMSKIQVQKEIEDILKTKRFKYANWKETGYITTEENTRILKEHSEAILKNTIHTNLKVVVDCGCGAGSLITPYVLKEMGCDVTTINSQPDGSFPGRNPEPTENNLSLLKKVVKAENADVGIAHDGDADRMVAVDNKGRFVSGDKMLTLFASHEADGKPIVVSVDASHAIDEVMKDVGTLRTKVGDTYIAEQLNKIGGNFGGEPSGALIFPKVSLCPDGIFAAAKLIEIIKTEGELSKHLNDIPEYPIKRGDFLCDDKEKTMAKIKEELENQGELSMIDGVCLDTEDGWVLVRPSGTEPKIRITVESRSSDRCMKLYENIEETVKGVICGL